MLLLSVSGVDRHLKYIVCLHLGQITIATHTDRLVMSVHTDLTVLKLTI